MNEIENELRKFPYLFVNTYCDIDVIEERLRQREENYVKTEDFKTILDSFYDYTMEQNMPYLRINTNIADSEKYANYILKCFNIIKEIFKENTKNDIYCGNFEAKNLVVISYLPCYLFSALNPVVSFEYFTFKGVTDASFVSFVFSAFVLFS